MKISARRLLISTLTITTFAILQSCGSGDSSTKTNLEDSLKIEVDSSNKLFAYNDVVFSLPSPYQFAFFIKSMGITYNKEYLNSTKSVSNYTTSFKQAINMGIYGTDLGYLNIYDQVPDAIDYFATLKVLSQQVGVANTFDQNTLHRIEQNMGNQDSLLYILSNKYREADATLKNSDRNSVAVLILAGGWIESLYILTQVAKDYPKSQVYQKIAEQKHPLDNLIKILSPYLTKSPEYRTILDQLISLAYVYDGVSYTYEFKQPTVDPANKITIVNSKSALVINDVQLKEITEIVSGLRTTLVK